MIVCSYNGERTIRDTLDAIARLDYLNYEVIVVDDGSTDATADIASDYEVRLISTENRGLSSARNTGWQEAKGEIVAYIDDDAYPDSHWLSYIASGFGSSNHQGIGGPNLAPPGDGFIADCVAHAPGGPVHVLISDREAEHIPGCNMAFRRDALQAIAGFDSQFRVAGDDVDVCWRLQKNRGTLGYQAAAVVWHHRRNSIRTYWRQQVGYGKAEAMLADKWPEKYNVAGHLSWKGRLYGTGLYIPLRFSRQRIYQGLWGLAPFQSVYEPATSTLFSPLLMPEWYLIVAFLAVLSGLGYSWAPLFYFGPLLIAALTMSLIQAGLSASKANFMFKPIPPADKLRRWGLTTFLHLMQPAARLYGRLRHGLTPWRHHGTGRLILPWQRNLSLWSEHWQSPRRRLEHIEGAIRGLGGMVLRGNDYDRWDLDIRGGLFGGVRVLSVTEEHGAGKQRFKCRLWPKCSLTWILMIFLAVALTTGSYLNEAWIAVFILGSIGIVLTARMMFECSMAAGIFNRALGMRRE